MPKKSNSDIFISPDSKVVLSKEKILMSYATLKEFAEFYGITSIGKAIKPPGLKWRTINQNHPTGVSKVYIDLEKTNFSVVPAEIKDAQRKLHEHENGRGGQWE